jgi:hypothetical protein
MEQIISKEEFDELINIKGEARGVAYKNIAKFILKEEGEEGLKKLEDTITSLGYPIEYKKLETMSFYPLGLLGITFLSIKRLFNYDNRKLQEIGSFQAKISLIMRLFMRYFVSLERIRKEVPKMWRNYFTVGELKVVEIDKNKRHVVIRLENFRLHPTHCQDLIGYFSTVLQMVVKAKTTGEETKCIHKGAEYHEFLLKW